MIRSMIAAATVAAGLWAFGAVATAQDKKETKLTGTLVCGKCSLKLTPKCSNVLQVKESGDKVVNYILDDKGNGEDYHEGVCGDGKIAGVTVTGTVSEKDGQEVRQAIEGGPEEEVVHVPPPVPPFGAAPRPGLTRPGSPGGTLAEGVRVAMTSGQLAKRAEVGVETLRFYEREGLLPKPARPWRPATASTRPKPLSGSGSSACNLNCSASNSRTIKELLAARDDPTTDHARRCREKGGRETGMISEHENQRPGGDTGRTDPSGRRVRRVRTEPTAC